MARYLAHCLHVLEREPIQIFGWPLFLPVCIARDYYSLWTQERMQAIVSAAKARRCGLTTADFYVPRRKTDTTPAPASTR